VDRATGLQATADTPREQIVERVYAVLPPEAQAWAREQGLPQPPPAEPASEDTVGSAETSASDQNRIALSTNGQGPSLAVNSPDAGAVYRLDPGVTRAAQRIVVSARSDAGAPLAQVALLVDGEELARFQAPPYRALWPLETGTHLFVAEGVDRNGKRIVSNSVQVEVRGP
jgi:penicillin-binding protein 1C